MCVPRHGRNRARGDSALGDFVAFVTIGPAPGISGHDHLTSIDFCIEVDLFGIHRRTAFREQPVAENDSGALETIREVVHFGGQAAAFLRELVNRKRAKLYAVCVGTGFNRVL